MTIRESGEDYLECILLLHNERGSVHATWVADEMGVSKASVSNAIKAFKENGYLTVTDEGHIELTESGLAIAKRINERHNVLTEALMRLGVPHETAAADACKIEHDISDITFECIKEHLRSEKKL